MKREMTKLGFEKLLAVLAVALVCVNMWGCSDDVTFEWDKSRGNAKIVGFIDDSLVMVGDYRFWHEITEGWNGDYREDEGVGNPRLCVYNYRVQENGPRWCDSLSELNSSGWFSGQLTDSVIWGGDIGGKMKIWKVGGLPHEIDITAKKDGCSNDFRIESVKLWLDGMFIAKNENSLKSNGQNCQYAVLDTVAKTLTYKRLDKNLKWIENCNDVRAWDDDVYCVILDDEEGNSLVLKNEKDTIPIPRKFAIGGFWGDMIKMSGNICSLNSDKITCSDVIWYGNELKFYLDNKIVVKY